MSTIQASGSTINMIGGGTRKFYRVLVAGTTEVRQWGRVGTSGQFKVIEHGGKREAEASAEKQLQSKVRKGYSGRRDVVFNVDESVLRKADLARVLSTTCDAAEAAINTPDRVAVPEQDELDDLLGMSSREPVTSLHQVADRALGVVTLAAQGDERAAVEYANLLDDMEAVEEQYERCTSLLETIEMMITSGAGSEVDA